MQFNSSLQEDVQKTIYEIKSKLKVFMSEK